MVANRLDAPQEFYLVHSDLLRSYASPAHIKQVWPFYSHGIYSCPPTLLHIKVTYEKSIYNVKFHTDPQRI